MPTIADLYNLIVQATNALIHAIHGLGLMIFILGLVYMVKGLVDFGVLVFDQHGWHNKTAKFRFIVHALTYLVGIGFFVFVVL